MKIANAIYISIPTSAKKLALEAEYDKVVYHKQPEIDKEQGNLYNHLTSHWVDMVFLDFCSMYDLAIEASREETLKQKECPTGCPDISYVILCNSSGKISFPEQ